MPIKNIHRAQFWARFLGHCPGVEAIFLSGSIAQGRDHKESDIDFFILATPGQIWTARFLVFVILKVCFKLAKPHYHSGQICPNHFITTDCLEIQEKDAYSANLFSHNVPLYDPVDFFSDFVAANSQWVKDFGHSFYVLGLPHKRESKALNQAQKWWELKLKKLQIMIIKHNGEYKTPGAKIVLTDKELRFHPVPKSQGK